MTGWLKRAGGGTSNPRMRLVWPMVLLLVAACLVDGIVTLWGQSPGYWARTILVNEADPLGRLVLILSPHTFTIGLIVWAVLLALLARRLPPWLAYPFWMAFFVGHLAGAASWMFPILFRRFYVDNDLLILTHYGLIAALAVPAGVTAYVYAARLSREETTGADRLPAVGAIAVGLLGVILLLMPFLVGRKDIFKAVAADNIKMVRWMIETQPEVVIMTDGEGRTPLHIAASGDHADLAVILIQKGADLDVADRDGWTPLHCAVFSRKRAALPVLLEAGSDVSRRDDKGLTPLLLAAALGHEQSVRTLLGRGADVNARDEKGRTPLHLAAGDRKMLDLRRPDRRRSFARGRVVKVLVEGGAMPNAPDEAGRTPLHIALEKGNLAVIQRLMKFGADASVADGKGRTPADLAREMGRDDLLEIPGQPEIR